MNRHFMAICIFCISCASWAQSGLSLSLRLIPEKQVLGCPVQVLVTIENSGKVPALVPNDHLIVLVMQLRLEGRAALLGRGARLMVT
jgi:hypothetical protein